MSRVSCRRLIDLGNSAAEAGQDQVNDQWPQTTRLPDADLPDADLTAPALPLEYARAPGKPEPWRYGPLQMTMFDIVAAGIFGGVMLAWMIWFSSFELATLFTLFAYLIARAFLGGGGRFKLSVQRRIQMALAAILCGSMAIAASVVYFDRRYELGPQEPYPRRLYVRLAILAAGVVWFLLAKHAGRRNPAAG